MKVVWDGEELDHVGMLGGGVLRALMLVQERVDVGAREGGSVAGGTGWSWGGVVGGRQGAERGVAGRLERVLMEKIVVLLEDQKEKLLETEVVREYLGGGVGGQ